MRHCKVSVIVPCYNVGCFIAKCLDSIISQTYRSLEVICVDDGSTDGTADILDDYSCRDKRIVVIKQNNKGASGSRNAGLALASGEYVMFVDGDDYIGYSMVAKMLSLAVKNKADIVRCNRADVYLAKDVIIEKAPIWNHKKIIRKDRFADDIYPLFFGRGRIISAYQALIRKKIVKGILFDEDLVVNEDEVFSMKIFNAARSFVYTPEVLYYHTISVDGLSGNGVDLYERVKSRKKCLAIAEDYSKKWGLIDRKKLLTDKRDFFAIYTAMQTAIKNPKYKKSEQFALYKKILLDNTKINSIRKERNRVLLLPERMVSKLTKKRMFLVGFYFSRFFGIIKKRYRFKLEKLQRRK